jgi:hypothetical protein
LLAAAAWASRMHWRRRKTTTTMPAMQSNNTTPLRMPNVGVRIKLLGRGSVITNEIGNQNPQKKKKRVTQGQKWT